MPRQTLEVGVESFEPAGELGDLGGIPVDQHPLEPGDGAGAFVVEVTDTLRGDAELARDAPLGVGDALGESRAGRIRSWTCGPTNAASVVVGFGMYAQSLIVPQLLQLPAETGYGLGQSMPAMGLWMAPGGLVMMAVSPIGGKLHATRGPKVTLLIGCLVIAAGYGVSLLLMGSTWGLMLVVCICSAGVGFVYGAMHALIMGAVPQSATASANSVNSLMRAVGTSVSAAVVGVVLSQMSVQVGGYSLPTEGGFRTGMLIGCGVAPVAAAVTLAIPVARRPSLEPVREPAAARV